MHPFLDTSKLTDEEILEKLRVAYRVLSHQVAMGHEPTVKSINEIIDALEQEKSLRTEKMALEQRQKKEQEKGNPTIELGKLE